MVYQFARAMQGIVATIFAFYRGRRAPGELAPSVIRQQTAADQRVVKASAKLQSAVAKQEATAMRIAKAKSKSLAGKSAPAKAKHVGTGPPAGGTGVPRWIGGPPAMASTMVPDPGIGYKHRPVVTGVGDDQGIGPPPSLAGMSPEMAHQLMQMLVAMNANGGMATGSSSSSSGYPEGAINNDVMNAFLQSNMGVHGIQYPQFYNLENPANCPECGEPTTATEANSTYCSSCGWTLVDETGMDGEI